MQLFKYSNIISAILNIRGERMEEYLTVKEVANLLKVSPRTVYSYIEFGYIRAVQVSTKKAIRIPKSSVEEFIQANYTTTSIRKK